MGLKTIRAKYDQARKEFEQTFGRFVKESTEANALLEQSARKYEASRKLADEAADAVFKAQQLVKKLEPFGVKQLADFKQFLMAQAFHSQSPKAIKDTEIRGLADTMKKQMEKDLRDQIDAYVNSLAASWPKEIKQGMVFKNADEDALIEKSWLPTQMVQAATACIRC